MDYQVIGTTPTGERVVFGFGFDSRADAEECAADFKREQPMNWATNQPYTYRVQEGGTPANVRVTNGRAQFIR